MTGLSTIAAHLGQVTRSTNQRGPDSPKCKEAITALLEQLAKNTNKPLRDKPDVLDIFDQMNKAGGIHINVPTGATINGLTASGGSGLSGMARGVRTTLIILQPGARGETTMKYEYAVTGIHEMIHQIAKYTMYGEAEVNAAPASLGFKVPPGYPGMSGRDKLDAYIKWYCIPQQFWN